jgi:sugar phosphate isomerase/epimerase
VRLAVGFQAAEKLRQNRAFQFIHDLDALTLLLNMVAAPNIGLLLDIWDIVAAGGSVETVRAIPAQQIVAVQVADMPAGVVAADLDEKSRLLPGGENGRIDLVAFFSILREFGYDGPITLKPSRSAFPNRRREAVVKLASETFDKVLRTAGVPLPSRPVPKATNELGEED